MFLIKNKFKTVAMGLAFCALLGCKSENSGEVKALGTQTAVPASQEKPQKESEAKQDDADKSLIKGKVRKVVGECDMQKQNADWNPMRIGQKVVENDRIRTAIESEVLVGVNDGSVLLVSELSEILFSAEIIDSTSKRLSVRVDKGNVHFDIQKRKKDMVEFRTGTAVAAIRGTAGFVGSVNGNMVASLKEGRVEVSSDKGTVAEIVENQTVLVNRQGKATTLKLKSSGTKALAKAIDSVATSAPDVAVPQLQNSLQKFDENYASKLASFEKGLKFTAAPIADSVFTMSVVLQAFVSPRTIVTVLGVSDTVGENGLYQREFGWDEKSYGTKRFLASCGDGVVEMPCYMWVTEYVEFTLDKPAEGAESKDSSLVDNAPMEVKSSASSSNFKNVNLKVAIDGRRNERIHLEPESQTYRGNLKFKLLGLKTEDLDQIKSIQVFKGKKVVKAFDENELTSDSYETPVSVDRNHIADYEVVVTAKNGKIYKAKKTFTVYCLKENHGKNGKKNLVSIEQEYERVKGKLVRD